MTVKATPEFGGYVALPVNSGDSRIVAWWTNGNLAWAHTPSGTWHAGLAPDYATLFPAAPTTPEPVVVADAPEGAWWCKECDSGKANVATDTRCYACGSPKP